MNIMSRFDSACLWGIHGASSVRCCHDISLSIGEPAFVVVNYSEGGGREGELPHRES